ncbi:TRAP transporter small permease [Roseobacter sp. YSTF-M11]|uniref:TRAP transporter small permease protein n=1 Tax=Roseobacter insulae TaxID=2859783 RepID=A0A9X1K150_9RHOB|nr:TRAP transporter small permease [Roseobacter insulae]MBW4707143.1 TRAP transporter small permease [Roseobacter insulae]
MQSKLEQVLLALGAIAVLLLGGVITANVIARAAFGSAVPDSVTIVRELMVAAILLPLAATTAARAHVCVDFISDRFGARLRSWLIVLGSLMGMIALAALIWAGARDLGKVWTSGSFFYGDLNLPKWPGRLIFVIGIGACWLRLAELAWRDTGVILRGGAVSDRQDHSLTGGGVD